MQASVAPLGEDLKAANDKIVKESLEKLTIQAGDSSVLFQDFSLGHFPPSCETDEQKKLWLAEFHKQQPHLATQEMLAAA